MAELSEIASTLAEKAACASTLASALRSVDPGQAPTLEALGALYVRTTLAACAGNKAAAARVLGISRRSLYRWLAREEG